MVRDLYSENWRRPNLEYYFYDRSYRRKYDRAICSFLSSVEVGVVLMLTLSDILFSSFIWLLLCATMAPSWQPTSSGLHWQGQLRLRRLQPGSCKSRRRHRIVLLCILWAEYRKQRLSLWRTDSNLQDRYVFFNVLRCSWCVLHQYFQMWTPGRRYRRAKFHAKFRWPCLNLASFAVTK